MGSMSIEINRAKRLVIEAGHTLVKEGLIARTWGNISARVSSDSFVITPSGIGYDDLTSDNIVEVMIRDCSFKGRVTPSSEKGVHAALYDLHPETDFIIHTHQNFATALSVLGEDIRNFDSRSSEILGSVVPVASYGMTSTPKLNNNVRRASELHPESKAVIMKNHGVLFMGHDDSETFEEAFALERVAKDKYRKYTGIDPYDITPITFSREYSKLGKDIAAYVDDFAQMFGQRVICLPNDTGKRRVLAELEKRKVLLVEGKGAFVRFDTEDETQAARLVLEKDCMAGVLAHHMGGVRPINPINVMKEHRAYIMKYSKLKDMPKL